MSSTEKITYQKVVGPYLTSSVQSCLAQLHYMFVTKIVPVFRPSLICKSTEAWTGQTRHTFRISLIFLTHTHTQTCTCSHHQVSIPHSDSHSAPRSASFSGWLWCYLYCDLSPPCGRMEKWKYYSCRCILISALLFIFHCSIANIDSF